MAHAIWMVPFAAFMLYAISRFVGAGGRRRSDQHADGGSGGGETSYSGGYSGHDGHYGDGGYGGGGGDGGGD